MRPSDRMTRAPRWALRRAVRRHGLHLAAGLACLAPASSAQLVHAPGQVPSGSPANLSTSENVDFGDVDLDGDWDVALADGGDSGPDQNRLWLNLGGLQGGPLGTFEDVTAQRMPVVNDQSRDVEFVDFDGDGDLDLFVANDSDIVNQGNRWHTNVGLAQGGALGSYVDETVARWVGLGGPGSSVPATHVLPSTGSMPGGFIDWSGDGDFADFDADGDLDLFQASYGPVMSGLTPSRIFLNDGAGYFSELDPSGFQPPGPVLAAGSPAIWAEGVYQPSTTDTTGAEADVATAAIDADLGDLDGDLDLDVLLGERDLLPRIFHNRLEESGALIFRDVSHAVLPPDWAVDGGNYEQELGDMDEDGDLDLFGLNWGPGAGVDRAFRNGGGTYGAPSLLPGSFSDDNEGDFLDYDNDGKLDLFIAAFSGPNKLYRNEDTGSGPIVYTLQQEIAVAGSPIATDADAADVDGDGDYDVMATADAHAPNYLLINTTGIPDTTAPRLERLEPTADGVASAAPHAVRVQVYDNAPYYVTWYDVAVLDVAVNGCAIGSFPMRSSGGQVFRGVLPGNLVGSVSYVARAEDEYGNSGSSSPEGYVEADVLGGSFAAFGADSGAGAPQLAALSVGFPGTTLFVGASGMTPGNAWFLAWNQLALPAPIAIPGTAIANVAGIHFFTYSGSVDASGCGVQAIFLPPSIPAVSTYFQMFEFPGDGADLLDSSRGLRVDLQP